MTMTSKQQERLERIRRKMPGWEERRRQLDEKERADGVSIIRTVSESENRRIEEEHRAAMRALYEEGQFERSEVLVAVVGPDGRGECVMVRPDGGIRRAKIVTR
jgi:hypothetical protein